MKSRLRVCDAVRRSDGAGGWGPQDGRQLKLYVLSSADSDMTVIDVATNTIIGSVEVGELPHGLATPSTEDILYVSTEGDNTLVVVDPATDRIVKEYPVLGNRPNEIDITPEHPTAGSCTRRSCAMACLRCSTPSRRRSWLGFRRTAGPTTRSCRPMGSTCTCRGDNDKIYVADTRTHTMAAISTEHAPRPIAVSPDGKWLYVNIDQLLGFKVLDLAKRKVVATAHYGLTDDEKAEPSRSHGVVVTPDGREVWASDVNHELVFVFDVTQNPPKQIARFKNPGDPYWLAVTPDSKTVYVASATDDTVTAYDVATKTQVAVMQLEKGKAPKRMQVLSVPMR